jgi:biotin carboxyl carrier protein
MRERIDCGLLAWSAAPLKEGAAAPASNRIHMMKDKQMNNVNTLSPVLSSAISATDRAAYSDLCIRSDAEDFDVDSLGTRELALMRRVSQADAAAARGEDTKTPATSAQKRAADKKAEAARADALAVAEAKKADAIDRMAPAAGTVGRGRVNNTETTVVDSETMRTATAPVSTVVVTGSRGSKGIDHRAFVDGVVAAFQPLAEQIARLEKANEMASDFGYNGKNRSTGEEYELRQLNALRSALRLVCRIAVNYADGSEKYPNGTRAVMHQAAGAMTAAAEAEANDEAQTRAGFMKNVGDHAHMNIGSPLAEAFHGIYEALLGEPLPAEEARDRAMSEKTRENMKRIAESF